MDSRIYLNTLLVSENQLKRDSLIQRNVNGKVLSSTLRKVQEEKLKPILGAELYYLIMLEAFKKATQTGYAIGDGLTELIGDYIQPYLVHAVIAECVYTLEFRFTNKGIKKMNDANASNLSPSELAKVRNYFRNTSINYKADLIKYLKANNLAGGMQDDDITFEATGWYLGSGVSGCGFVSKTFSFNTDKYYVHTQDEATTVWNIEHKLEKFPSVSVVGTDNKMIACEVEYLDSDNIALRFNSAIAGKAYLN